MATYKFKSTNDFINKNTIPLDTPVKPEYDKGRNKYKYDKAECLTHNFVVKLDTQVEPEYDELESSSCHTLA